MNMPEVLVFALIGLLWVLVALGVAYLYRRTLPSDRMMSAARIVATTFGVGAGLLGLEHGYFETLQGNATPTGLVISAIGPPCQPAAAWHGCEPALTLIPDFLVTGVVAMVVALAVLIWAAAFVQRRHGGTVLAFLTIVLFMVGGGFTTLWLGVLAGIAGTRIDAPLSWWRAHLPAGLARLLARLWLWLLIAYLGWAAASWVIAAFSSNLMLRLTPLVTIITPLVLVLILVSAVAHDIQPETGEPRGNAARLAGRRS